VVGVLVSARWITTTVSARVYISSSPIAIWTSLLPLWSELGCISDVLYLTVVSHIWMG
jgi:hypothetical protein